LPPHWPVTDQRLASYEKCPRRFFYTHVLGLGTARRTTPFTKAHDCLYHLIEWLAEKQVTGSPTLEEAEAALETSGSRRARRSMLTPATIAA
jgi:hypothetical protein